MVSPPPTTLLSLPNELLLEVAQHLPRFSDLNSLLLCNQRLCYVLSPHLIERAAATIPIGGRDCSVIHWAAAHGDSALLQKLLPSVHRKKLLATFDLINSCDRDGHTPLYAATMNNDSASVALLLEHGAEIQASDTQSNPLLYAVHMGNHDIIQLLLNAGANPGAVSAHGFTLLHIAVASDDHITVKMLLEAGASVEDPNCFAIRPVDVARTCQPSKSLELLEQRETRTAITEESDLQNFQDLFRITGSKVTAS
ncbi:ankyrin repeat-containing domain protein [Tirmania nivea]|nr:ankyrin repeat-containing domain protein [Tirmania nivea]